MTNDPINPSGLDESGDDSVNASESQLSESQLSAQDVLQRLERLWPTRPTENPLPQIIGRRLGRYEIRSVLGSGSFGIVYLAHDLQLGRDCALKVPRTEVLVDDEKRRRFNTEAAAAATLAHPGIVPVYEAEIDGEMPYIASAICTGPNLADWLGRRDCPIPEKEVARFVAQLADAVHYAHQRGVYHRDLKPSNVLLDPCGVDTGADGELEDYVPRLTDFGLAKLAESDSAATRSSMLLGTPVYMAPEQLGSEHLAADPRLIDVYDLGCLLYELLSGNAPFARDSVAETLLAVRDHEPVLRHRRRDVSTNLEAVCHKAIEKRPQERYASVRELADDLERLLDDKEVRARPITPWERGVRWCRRNRLIAASIVVSFAAMLAVAMVTLWHNAKLADALKTSNDLRAEALLANTAVNEAKRSLQRELYAREIKLAFDAKNKQWNEEVDRILGLFEDPDDEDVRTFPWYMLASLTSRSVPLVLSGHQGAVREVAVHPDGERIVSVGDDGTIRVWDVDSGEALATISASQKTLNALAISPNGEYVATGAQGLALWRLTTGERVRPLTYHSTTIEEAAFSPDGTLIASAARNWHIHVVSTRTGDTKKIQTDSGNESLVFSDGGRRVMGVRRLETANAIQAWNSDSGDLMHSHPFQHGMRPVAFALTSDERRVAVPSHSTGQVVLYDAETWRALGKTEKLRATHEDICFSPDDRLVAVAGRDGMLRYWHLIPDWTHLDQDVIRGKQVAIPAHEGRVNSITFAGPRRVVTAGEDGLVKVWPLDEESRHLHPIDAELRWLSILPGSRDVLEITGDGQLVIRDDDDGAMPLRANLPDKVWLEAPPSGSDLLVIAGPTSTIEVCDITSPDVQFIYELEHDVKAAAVSPNSRWLAATGVDGYTAVWLLATRQRLFSHKLATWGTCVRFSPQSDYLAVGGRVSEVLVIETASWQIVHRLRGISDTRALAFSPDGRTLATAHRDAVIRVWDVESGELTVQLKGHHGTVGCLTFHPSGDTLVSAASRDSIRCWDLGTHRELGVVIWLADQHAVDELRFDEPGRTLTAVIRDAITRRHKLLRIETDYPVP